MIAFFPPQQRYNMFNCNIDSTSYTMQYSYTNAQLSINFFFIVSALRKETYSSNLGTAACHFWFLYISLTLDNLQFSLRRSNG